MTRGVVLTRTLRWCGAVILSEAKDLAGAEKILRFAQDDKAAGPAATFRSIELPPAVAGARASSARLGPAAPLRRTRTGRELPRPVPGSPGAGPPLAAGPDREAGQRTA